MQNYVGQQIDRYRITERLGTGGMAVVYKAYDTRLERDVALKLIRTEAIPPEQYERLMKRFEREAKAQARFDHKHIVHVYDYGEVQGSPYLVMSYVPGGTLKEKTGQPVDYRQAIQWLLPVADALAYAHEFGVIHRDIKPSNILFDAKEQPILTDFGIAKVLETDEATLTGTGLGVGTPEYMAPEQWQGKASPATDQYALGVVLYELITGQKPYSAETPAAVAILQATEQLPRPKELVSGIPEIVENVLYKSLTRNAQDRYEDMLAFKQALVGLLMVAETNYKDEVLISDQQTYKKLKSPSTINNIGETFDILGQSSANENDKHNKMEKPKRVYLPKWLVLPGAILLVLILFMGALSVLRLENWPIRLNRHHSMISPTSEETKTVVPVDINIAEQVFATTPNLLTSTEEVTVTIAPTLTTPTIDVTIANTPTPFSAFVDSIYDDFNNLNFDGDFNRYLWRCWEGNYKLVRQQNGILKIEGVVRTSLIAIEHTDVTIDEPFFYEAFILIGEDTGFGDATIKLHVDLADDDYWTTQFGILVPNIIYSHAGVKETDYNSYEKETRVNPEIWYHYRIEVNPLTRKVDYYLNGELFGSANIPVEQDGRYSFVFGIGAEPSNKPVTAYFDDVNFGPIQ
jgi:serine/threonine protein kinase